MLGRAAASPIINQAQAAAQSALYQASLSQETQNVEMALFFYDQAKVAFKHLADAQQILPLTEVKDAVSRARTPQTAEEESLRQRIAEVYFERAQLLEKLGKVSKAQASYKKAQYWGHKAISAASAADASFSANNAISSAPPSAFFPVSVSLTPSPQVPEARLQEKHQWVAQVFETIVKQCQDLDLCQGSPNLFLVYAHNNHRLGKADAEVSQRVIQWLSNLRSNLYSDRSASGHQALPFPATAEDSAKANDILSSQLCLLPNHAGTVGHVVLCGSELLGHYMDSPYYQGFCEAIQRAYQEASERTDDFAQVEAAIRRVVDANLNEKEFHHVLTELAFLQIRYAHLKGEHGIIPLLLNSRAQQCLPKFILDSTTIRIEDSIWRTPSNWKGQQTYQDEGLHIGFFKLLKRLVVKQERCIALMEEKIYQSCLQKLREDHAHTLISEEFYRFLSQSCVAALNALKKEHGSDLRELNVQKAYESILSEIKQLNGESLIEPNQLRSALAASYSAKGLAIQRLSGPPLPMEHCYINLAIVEHEKEKIREEDKSQEGEEEETNEEKEEPNYFYRLPSVEAIRSNPQKLVQLEKLFDPRELSKDKTITPKRILIRGRAGVGKTTLSKKIVYEYTQQGQWQDRFDYVLWIPLRTLKGKQNCDLTTLFYETYFQHRTKGRALAKTLEAQINGPAKEKTLFVLDGWDEVAQEWDEQKPMAAFLNQLLNQPAVLITSRPYVDLKQANPMDLELETIGFSPENVMAYLDNQAIMPASQAKEIKHFIQASAFLQELVNVPIQLDVFCFSWDEIKRSQQAVRGPVTAVALYQAMMNKLWRKDMLRLGKREAGELLTESQVNALRSALRIEKWVKSENDFLSTLAFAGLQDNRIEFDTVYLDSLIEQLEVEGVDLPITLEANLKELSFLHTDDAKEEQRSYHFMHLTFQEFFAAKFLVRHFQVHAHTHRQSLPAQTAGTATQLGVKPSVEELEAFIATHKYNPRYEIVWWMMAGLLKGTALERFFTLLNAAPRDLIGMCHQQLMMGCLHEARLQLKPATIDKLEAALMQWLDFEIKNEGTGYSLLGSQRAFPEHLLVKSLSRPTAKKEKMIATLGARSVLSDDAVFALLDVLQGKPWYVRPAAESALCSQRKLSADAVLLLIYALMNGDEHVRYAAGSAICNQSTLSADAVLALLNALMNGDEHVRYAAARALCSQRKLSADAVFALLNALKNEDAYVRRVAASALGNQSMLSADAVLALLDALKDKEGNVRRAADSALGSESTLSAAAVLVLVDALKNDDKHVRYVAARALCSQSMLSTAAVLALLDALKDKDENVRSAAESALGSQRMLAADAVLLEALKDEDEHVRRVAASALGRQSTLSTTAVLALLDALKDEDWTVKSAAESALGSQSRLSADAILVLLDALKDEDKNVRYAAARALGSQSTLSADAVLTLLDALKDKDRNVRRATASALGRQSTLSAAAALALFNALKDTDGNVRSAAESALCGQSTLSADAFLALLEASKNKDNDLLSAVESAWGGITLSPAEVLALLNALKSKRASVRMAAASALGSESTLSADAVLALLDALKDKDWAVRKAAVSALGCQCTLSADMVLALLDVLKDEDEDVSRAAENALCSENTLSADAVLALLDALKDDDWLVRYTAVSALSHQSTLSADAVLALVDILKDENEDEDISMAAARALCSQCTLSIAAVLALLDALKDKDWNVRHAAESVLGSNMTRLFTSLEYLNQNQVEALYTQVLFPISCKQITPLYIQDHQLHFYTATGLGQPIELSAEQSQVITEAFKTVQTKAGIISPEEEEKAMATGPGQLIGLTKE